MNSPARLCALFGFTLVLLTPAGLAQDGQGVNPQKMYLRENAQKPGWRSTTSGLQYRVVRQVNDPTARKPGPDDKVKVNYRGTLIDGTEFDSSQRNGGPIEFPLKGLIKGWTEGIALMRVGEVFDFAIPAELGYGATAKGSIPAGATLLFTVELLGVRTPDNTNLLAPRPAVR